MLGQSQFVRELPMPRLGRVVIDSTDYSNPQVRIYLSPDYCGDLNDLEPCGPDGLYLACDSTSCINDPKLAKFMQVLKHWDHDGDGIYDADHIIDAIEEALWQSREEPDVFRRPNPKRGLYTKALMALMPPPPERHIVFSFGELRDRIQKRHYLWAIPMVFVVLALILVQVHFLPWMQYSVMSGVVVGAEALGIPGPLALGFMIGVLIVKIRRGGSGDPATISMHTYGFFNRAALFEEQAFREGAENWNLRQRITSCLVFGAVHMVNLFYPLATILPLALGGGIFMWFYLREYRRTHFRRSAALKAAVAHRVYNRVALSAMLFALVVWALGGIVSLFALGATLLAAATLACAGTFAIRRRSSVIGTAQPQQI